MDCETLIPEAQDAPVVVAPARSRRWPPLPTEYGTLAVIIAAGLGLRLWGLTSKSLWIDETFSIGIVSQSWHSFGATLGLVQPNMEFFYLLLKLAASITPASWQQGEFFWRLLPALAGTATIAAVYPLVKRLFGVPVALTAAALVAVNEFMVEYSQQARGYTLFVLILTLAYIALVRWLEGSRAALFWFAALTALGFLTQAFEVVFLTAQLAFVAAIAWRGRRICWRPLALALAPVGLIIALRYPIYAAHPDQVAWIQRPTLHDLIVGAMQLSGGDGGVPSRFGLPILIIAVAAVLGLTAYALVSAMNPAWLTRDSFQEHPARLDTVEALTLVLTWIAIPIVGTWVGSQLKPVWVTRYLAPTSIAIAIAIAAALGLLIALVRHTRAREIAFAAVVALALLVWFVPLHHYQARAGWEDWRGSARFVATQFRANDGIVCYDNQWGCDFGFSHYFAGTNGSARLDPQAPGAFSWHTYSLPNREAIFAQAVAPAALAPYLAQHRRLWVLMGHYTAGQGDWAAGLTWLDTHAQRVSKTIFTGDIEVYLYEFGGN